MQIYVTMYYKPFAGMTDKQKRLEGGATDQMGNPLYSLEDYLLGTAKYVSLSRDYLAGPPGGDSRFTKYGTVVHIPEIDALVDCGTIEFRLVDTGDAFHGDGKRIKSKGAEPIDVCRTKPLQFPRTEGLMTLQF